MFKLETIKQKYHSRDSTTSMTKDEFKKLVNNEKFELLADISQFANTKSGLIIYGITDGKKRPREIMGIQDKDIELITCQIDNICTDNLKIDLFFKAVPVINSISTKVYVLIVIIPESKEVIPIKHKDGKSACYIRLSHGKKKNIIDDIPRIAQLSQEKKRLRKYNFTLYPILNQLDRIIEELNEYL